MVSQIIFYHLILGPLQHSPPNINLNNNNNKVKNGFLGMSSHCTWFGSAICFNVYIEWDLLVSFLGYLAIWFLGYFFKSQNIKYN